MGMKGKIALCSRGCHARLFHQHHTPAVTGAISGENERETKMIMHLTQMHKSAKIVMP